MKRIPLTKGKEALVDDQDYEYLVQFKWHAGVGGKYVTREKSIHMHQVLAKLMDFPVGLFVDHINGNGLDNRRENLRPASHQNNLMNRGPQVNNTSGFKGVTFDRSRGKWKAQLKKDQKMIYQARFDDKVEAAKAYNAAVKKHFGDEFAWLNPIPGE